MFSFSDSAFIGKQPGNTTAETLATLGLMSSAGVVLDYAFLGLCPGRFTARRAAFIGLLNLAGTVPPVAPHKTGGSGAWKRAIVVQKKRDSNREIEELVACGAV